MSTIVGTNIEVTNLKYDSDTTSMIISNTGQVTIQGEGTATTNLQQGIAKQWVLQKQKTSHQTLDSFNTSSVDDHATAVIEPKFTSNMASNNYALTGGLASGIYNGCMMMPSSNGGDETWDVATTGYYVAGRGNGNNYTLYADIERVPVTVHGDLA